MGAEPRRQLNRRPEQVPVILDGLPGRGTDAHGDREVFVGLGVRRQLALGSTRATNRRDRRMERSHDAVPGVLDFTASRSAQRPANDFVVDAKQGHRRIVPQLLRQRRRVDDVREQHGPDARVTLALGTSRYDGGTRLVHLGAPEESLGHLGCDFDDLLGDQSMGFTVDRLGRFRTRCAAETEDLPEALVEPVLWYSTPCAFCFSKSA
jgi:hypothetical protein